MKKRFHKVNIEISNICNLQCSFCPAVQRHNQMMDLELFREVVRQVAPLTELICFHLMGEPLVHPDLPLMLDICEEYQANIFLVTNGVLMRPDKFELLLHPRFYQINFSLHSYFDKFPDSDGNRYLQRIFEFTELAMKERPELYLNYRLWNLQQPRQDTVANKSLLERVAERFDFTVPEVMDVRNQKSFRIKDRLYLHFDTEFIWPSLDLPILGQRGTCYGLRSHFGVLVDGTVVPCCLDKEASIPLGNIKDTAVTDILSSPRATTILKGFQEKRLVEKLCQRCQYIERFVQ